MKNTSNNERGGHTSPGFNRNPSESQIRLANQFILNGVNIQPMPELTEENGGITCPREGTRFIGKS